jgi:hypothetical protein
MAVDANLTGHNGTFGFLTALAKPAFDQHLIQTVHG